MGIIGDPAQVRSIDGWHLAQTGSIAAGQWDITLRGVSKDIAAKAVILDVASPPHMSVVIDTKRRGLARLH